MGGKSSKDKKSSEPQVIVVFGATGLQGGSVLQAMKDDDKFKIRAVTRNVESDKAKALAEQGIDVVQADLDDTETLNKAVEGAFGVFLNTNFWEHMDGEKELQQGKNLTDACLTQKVQFIVASTLEDLKAQIGKECPHFDYKAKIEEYIKEKGVPMCAVRVSYYIENLINELKPRKNDDGEYILDIPMGDVELDMVNVTEIGECIHQIFLNHTKYKNKAIGLSSDKKTIAQYAEILGKHFEGKTFKASEITVEQFAELGFPGCETLAVMFEFYQKGKFSRDVQATKKLNPNILDFDAWVNANKDKIEPLLE